LDFRLDRHYGNFSAPAGCLCLNEAEARIGRAMAVQEAKDQQATHNGGLHET
jgi:hypothetical protein